MRIIKWLLSVSVLEFSLAGLASIVGGLLTIAIMVLVFRLVGQDEEVRLELFVVLCAGAVASRALARTVIRSISRRAVFHLRVDLFKRILAAPLADLERIGQSKLTMVLMDDIGRIAAIVPNLVLLCTNITLFAAFLAYLGWLSPGKLAVILLAITIGAICDFLLRREGTKQVRVSNQKRNDVLDVFRTGFTAVKELKLHSGRREQMLGSFVTSARELQTSVERQSSFFSGSAAVAQALFYVTLGLVMFDYAGGTVDRHVVVSFGIGIIYLMRPLQASIQITQELAAADIALDRVEELGFTLDQTRERRKRDGVLGANPAPPVAGDFETIEFSGVTHSYETDSEAADNEFSLGPIDLAFAKGEIVFVVGGNGSGKTTFAKILAGLYWPTAGSILLNGKVIGPEDAESYSQLFSAVFYDFFIFEHCLEGKECSDDLLRRFKIDGSLQMEAGKILNSFELSLGERKRLALMFTYLDDKPIIILDEWAADQDPNFKEIFYRDILRELKDSGKLVVVISHDDRYFDVADRVVRLESGKLTREEALPAAYLQDARV
jgi:putative ATP-binding cassette transporter